jgi:shikimate kinase
LARPAREYGSISTAALVGFMGAGKTTVGYALAERLGWRFADLDQLIQAQENRTIPEIFQQEGEAAFRKLECHVLARTLASSSSEPLVVALGGGAFVSEGIRGLLKKSEVPTIWLDAPCEELFRRCEQPEVVRPLRRDAEQFTKLYEQRLSSYRQADFRVVTTNKEISAVVEEIIVRLNLPQQLSRGAE